MSETCQPAGPPRLRPDRRHRRVRDAGGRREGQGAQGRRRPVIGFGAGEPDFPTPEYIVEAAVEACRDPRNHRYTPAGGLPELKEAIVDEDRARLRVRRSRPPRSWSPTAASRRSTRRSRRSSTRATRCSLPAPYWTTYPEAIRLAGGVPVEVLADETQDYKVTVDQLEAARTDRTKALLFCSPSNPTGAVYTAERGRGDRPLGCRARPLGGHRRDLRAPDLRRHETASLPVRGARARGPVRRRERRREDLRDDRLAGRLAARPEGRRQGRHQPAVARDVQRRQRRPARGDRGARRRPDRGRGDAGGLRPAAAHDGADAQRDPRRRVPRADRRVLRLPVGEGRARPGDRRARPRRRRPSWPRSSSTRPRWPSCRARRSARRATCGCPTRSATTTWPRASAGMQKLFG